MRHPILLALLLAACGDPPPETPEGGDDTPVDDETDPPAETDETPETDEPGETGETDPPPPETIQQDGPRRTWSDGSHAASCWGYRHPSGTYVYEGDVGDGVYAVDPDGDGTATDVWCDMTTDGGGWTLVSQNVPVEDAAASLCTADAVGTLDLDGTTTQAPAKWADADIDALWDAGSGDRELLVLHHQDAASTDTTRSDWTRACRVDFVDTYGFHAAFDAADLADLEDPQVTCDDGTSATMTQTNNHASYFCGYSFRDATEAFVLTYSGGTPYTTGTCSPTNAGRSWSGTPNYGCNASKQLVR